MYYSYIIASSHKEELACLIWFVINRSRYLNHHFVLVLTLNNIKSFPKKQIIHQELSDVIQHFLDFRLLSTTFVFL